MGYIASESMMARRGAIRTSRGDPGRLCQKRTSPPHPSAPRYNFRDDGIKNIAAGLITNRGLKFLGMSFNLVGGEGSAALGAAVSRHVGSSTCVDCPSMLTTDGRPCASSSAEKGRTRTTILMRSIATTTV